MRNIKNSLGQSHDIMKKIIKPGDIMIDGTAGNGNDTIFLANLVGDKGRVYAFDIQKQAINNTKKRLIELGLMDRVKLIEDSHAYMDKYIYEKIKGIMFNLGYLPKGDHSIATRGSSTIVALEKAMKLLTLNGVITIVIYHGGDSGFEEKEQVLDFIKGLNSQKYTVAITQFINQINYPPILACIEKIAP